MPTEEQSAIFWDTIQGFDEADLLPHLAIVGSWAEYIYEQTLLQGYSSGMKTRDVDFLIPNIRKPRNKTDIIHILEQRGFLVQQSPLSNQHRFFKPELEVEFLVREIGAGQSEAYDVPSLGIKVTGLRFMELLANNLITVAVRGFSLQVPLPAAYLFHKAVIRRQTEEKAAKDMQAVMRVLTYLRRNPAGVESLRTVFGRLTKKQQVRVTERFRENNADIGDIQAAQTIG